MTNYGNGRGFYCDQMLDKSMPGVQVKQEEKAVVLQICAPGLTSDDIEVTLGENKALSIKAKKTSIFCKSLAHTFALDDASLDVKKITAVCVNGILNVTLPHIPEKKPVVIKVE